MIKINLLPGPKAKKVKKQAEAQSQVVLAGLIFIGIVLICGYSLFGLNKEINRLNNSKIKLNKDLAQLKEVVKEVENFEENKKNLEEKNRIIEQLKKNQTGPVYILDEIGRNLDPLKLWLISLTVRGKNLELKGKSITNSDIVEFIKQMKGSKFFKDVSLVESRQMTEANISVYSFTLKSVIVL